LQPVPESDQVTPLFWLSFATAAVKSCVLLTWIEELAGETPTDTAATGDLGAVPETTPEHPEKNITAKARPEIETTTRPAWYATVDVTAGSPVGSLMGNLSCKS
jgi:hypothetical protein